MATAIATASAVGQTTKTIVTVINPSATGCGGGWMADPNYNGVTTTTADIPFWDPLPPDVTVRTISIQWQLASSQALSHGTPTVSAAINGTPLVGSYALTNVTNCDPALFLTYTFASPDYPNGFPGYLSKSTNHLYLTLSGGQVTQWDSPVATITYNVPPQFEFNATDQVCQTTPADCRILLSNPKVSNGYPYPTFQRIAGGDGLAYMSVRGRDAQDQYVAPGTPLYLRVIDPPDPSRYVDPAVVTGLPLTIASRQDDNLGTKPIIDGNGITQTATPGVFQGAAGADGLVEFRLHLQPGTASGDNYKVEVSYSDSFPSGGGAKSGTFTAWKRIWVEKRHMLRNGVWLAQDASVGDTSIVVTRNTYGGNAGQIRRGDRVVLVHSPQLDRSNVAAGTYKEEHTVASITSVPNSANYRVAFGTTSGKTVTPEYLQHPYRIELSPGRNQIGDQMAKLGGTTLSSADYFDASDDLLVNSVFPASFVEYIMLNTTTIPGLGVPIPSVQTTQPIYLQELADRWSASVQWNTQLQASRAEANTQLLVIGDVDGSSQSDAGLTEPGLKYERCSYVFRGAINAIANTQTSADAWAMKTATHEVAHQWNTDVMWQFRNPTNCDNTRDHCTTDTKAYDNSTVYCLEAMGGSGPQSQRDNGIATFHMRSIPDCANTGQWQSEYLQIRRAADPFVP